MTQKRYNNTQHLPVPSQLKLLLLTISSIIYLVTSSSSPPRVITEFELSEYIGTSHEGDKTPVWISILGSVYDVTAGGADFYGPERGYNFFAGKDASVTFVTGEFNPKGLLKDLESLSDNELKGIAEWKGFYEEHEKYHYVGVLEGLFFDEDGKPTEKLERIWTRLGVKKEL